MSSTARIGQGVEFGADTVIGDHVEIGDGVRIGHRVTLRHCRIGNGVRIEDNAIIGYETLTGGFSHQFEERHHLKPTIIGEETLIRTGCVIYPSVEIGSHCWINHQVLVREHTAIGHHTCIGSLSLCEGYLSIGNHVLVHSQVHLCARVTIEDYVFLAPLVVFTNGNPMNYQRDLESPEQGATVRFGAQLGANSLVMPRVVIGYEAWIGPATLVNRDVPPLAMALGSPGRIIKTVPAEMRLPLKVRRQYYGGAEDPPASTAEQT